jgi:hypothetical protein
VDRNKEAMKIIPRNKVARLRTGKVSAKPAEETVGEVKRV